MAEGPIPWTTAIFYAEKYGWEDEDGFWRVISAMDSKYMSIVHKER